MKKIILKSFLFVLAGALGLGGFMLANPKQREIAGPEVVQAATGSVVTTAKREELATTNYVYEIYSYEGKSTSYQWKVYGGGLYYNGVTANTADELIEIIDNDRYKSSEYQDCVLKFPDKFLYHTLELKNGTYYITAPSASDSVALDGKKINVQGDLLKNSGYEYEGTIPTGMYITQPSAGITVCDDAELYIYDCTLNLIEALHQSKTERYDNPSIYIDNADINFSTTRFKSSYVSSGVYAGSEQHVAETTSSVYINGFLGVYNTAIISSVVPEVEFFETTSEWDRELFVGRLSRFKDIICAEGGYFDAACESTYMSVYNNMTFTNRGYTCFSNLVRINLTAFPTGYGDIDYVISNSGAFALNGEPQFFYNYQLSDYNVGFSFSSGGYIDGAYDLSRTYNIYINETFKDKDLLVRTGQTASYSNFVISGGYIGEYIGDDTTNEDKLIAEAVEGVSNQSIEGIIYDLNYYICTLYESGGSAAFTQYDLYIPVGQAVKDAKYGTVSGLSNAYFAERNHGYELTGWEWNYRTSSTRYDITGDIADFVPEAHATIRPEFEIITYAINFDTTSLKGASVSSGYNFDLKHTMIGYTKTLPTIAYLQNLPDQERKWKFLGWSLTPDGEVIADNKITITADNFDGITLYAVYQKIWTIYFNHDMDITDWVDDKGEVLDEIVFEYYVLDGETLNTTPGIPLKNKYWFDYWYITDEAEEFDFKNTPITADIDFNAKWIVKTYSVVFEKNTSADLDAVNWPQNQTVDALSKITRPTGVYSDGYQFVSWYDAETNQPINFNATIEKNTRVRAEWLVLDYAVYYTLVLPDGETCAEIKTGTTYTTNLTIETLGAIAVPGADDLDNVPAQYKFLGWKINGSGEVLTSIVATKENYKNLTLVAVFGTREVGIIIHLNLPASDVEIVYETEFAPLDFFDSSFTLDEAKKTLSKDFLAADEVLTLPNVHDLYCSDGKTIINHWYIGDATGTTSLLQLADNIAYSVAVQYIDENDKAHIFASAEVAEFAFSTITIPSEVLGTEMLSITTEQYGYMDLALFVVNGSEITLVETSRLAYLYASAKEFAIGENKLLFVWAKAGTVGTPEEYEDFLGIPKLMHEFVVNIVPRPVVVPTYNVTFQYDGREKFVHSGHIKDIEEDYTTVTSVRGTDAGEYTYTLSLKDPVYTIWADGTSADKSRTWVIDQRAVHHQVNEDGTVDTWFEYTGSAQIVSVYKVISEYDDIPESEYALTGDWSAVNAGTYTATFTLTKNYVFYIDGGYGSSVTFTWEIEKKKLARPGGSVWFEWDKDSVGDEIITYEDVFGTNADAYSKVLTMSGDTRMGDIGKKTAIFTITDTNNYKWYDRYVVVPGPGGSSAPQIQDPVVAEFSWTIAPKQVRLPSVYYVNGQHYEVRLTTYEDTVRQTINLSTYWEYYEGYSKTVYVDYVDAEYVAVNGETSATDAGDYQFEIELIYQTNTIWKDANGDTYDSSNITITWNIEKCNLPSSPNPEIIDGVLVPNLTNIMPGDTVLYAKIESWGFDSFGDLNYAPEVPTLTAGENDIAYRVIRANPNYTDCEGSFGVEYTPPEPEPEPPATENTTPEQTTTDEKDGGNPAVLVAVGASAVVALGGVSVITIRRRKRRK